MEIAKRIAGFSPAEADDLRKGIGKKDRRILDRLEPKFREGALASGTQAKVVDHLWGLMEKAGDYSFNKSHAACYAFIAYRTAYLKANYPVEYMAALISSVMNTKDKVPFYVSVANDMGIEVLPPDVNESSLDFRVVEARIRFGLNAVKNVGETAIKVILESREKNGPFRDLFDFCRRVDLGVVNRRALESLIKAGGLDSLKASRRGMLQVLPQAMGQGQKAQDDSALGQGSIFDLLQPPAAAPPSSPGTGGGASSSAPIGNDGGGDPAPGAGAASAAAAGYPAGSGIYTGPPIPIPEEDFSREELLALEKETLGLYLSSHPLRDLRPYIRSEAESTVADLLTLPDGSVTRVIGMIAAVKKITTKRSGETMAFVTVEGLEGSVEMLCFPAFYLENAALLVEDKVVRIKGRVDKKDEAETKIIPLEIEAFVPKTGLEPVCLLLDGARLPRSVVDDLKAILDRFPGGCPVEVQVDTPAGLRALRFGEGYKVDPQTSLFAELKVLLGAECVLRAS